MTDPNQDAPISVDDAEAAVRAAEQDAVEAEALADTLEQQFLDGADDVNHEQIEKQRKLSGFARMQVERARRRADRARVQRREAALAALRGDIDGYVADAGARLAKDLQAFLDARATLLRDAAAHDEQVSAWTNQAQALDAPKVDASLRTRHFPSEIALGRAGIESLVVGGRRLRRIEGASFLENVLRGISSGVDPQLYVDQVRAIDADESA